MTFTYTPSTPTDVTRVRFQIGDTDSSSAMLQDEDITFQIAETGDYKHAVISCLEYIIAKLGLEGEFTAGWLTVRQGTSIASYERLLAAKRQEFGIPLITASAVAIYRPDNTSTTTPVTWDSTGNSSDFDLDGDDD